MARRYKNVNPVTKRLADGTERRYYYHRKTGKKIESEGPHSPDWDDAYNKAAGSEAKPAAKALTLADLVDQYQTTSPKFLKLSEGSKKDYERYLKSLVAQMGTMPVEAMEDRRTRGDVLEWRDSFLPKERTADYAMAVAAAMFAWAFDRSKINVNVLLKPGRLYKSDRAELIFSDDDLRSFGAVAYPELTMTVLAAIYLGLRESDLVGLNKGHYRDGEFRVRTSKRGRWVTIPVHAHFRPTVERVFSERMLLLATKTGRPWKVDYLRHEYREYADKAGLSDLNFHDTRGTAVTKLAEAGATNAEIASITGWSADYVQQVIDNYLAAHRSRRLAESAISKLEADARDNLAAELLENGGGQVLQTELQTKANKGGGPRPKS